MPIWRALMLDREEQLYLMVLQLVEALEYIENVYDLRHDDNPAEIAFKARRKLEKLFPNAAS
jgi:hypothetical protein